jgi:hypothetical protein
MRGGIADYPGNANSVLRCTFYRRFDTNRRAGQSGMAQTTKMGESAEVIKKPPGGGFL